MVKSTRRALNLIIATAALVFTLAVGAPALDPGGRHATAAAKPMTMNDTGDRERMTVPMQTARRSPEVKIPPLDAAVPAHTETATFALG
jgi:hypothetical protein